MLSTAISVPEDGIETWIAALADTGSPRSVEVPLSALLRTPSMAPVLERNGLRIAGVTRTVPPGFTAHYLAADAAARRHLEQQLRGALHPCRTCGARRVLLEFEIEEIEHAGSASAAPLGQTAELLRVLLPNAVESGLVLCLPVRLPFPFPGARAWTTAGNLIHEVMHPACRLAVNLFPSELPPGFDLPTVLRDCFFHLESLRIHLAADAAAEVTRHTRWATDLHRHGFRGAVVFCAQASSPEGIAAACGDIRTLADLYG